MKMLALIPLLLLAACAAPTNSVIVRCGVNSAWSEKDQLDLADAIEPLPEGSVFLKLELDWQTMRDANKACARASKS